MKTNFRFPSGTGCSGRLLHGALHTLAAALLLFAGSACENEDPDVYTPPAPEPLAPLTLVPNMDPRVQNDIEIEEETTGVYRIHTTGEDPYFCTVPFDGNVPADLNVLAFEYQTDRRTDHIQLFFWTEVDGEVIPDVERTIVTTPFAPSTVTSTPCRRSRSDTTCTSRISGTFFSTDVPGASNAATMALLTKFFAPRTLMVPFSGLPPSTCRMSFLLSDTLNLFRFPFGSSSKNTAA